MRNGLARHVKTNTKDRVKQKIIGNADSCKMCLHTRGGYFSDTMHCNKHDRDVFKWQICDKFERRE